ncbi:MAG: methyl-accepting chemotaxis protein [Myxococcaceae bacterium]
MSFKLKIILLPVMAALFLLVIFAVTATLGLRSSELLRRIEAEHSPAVELNHDLHGYLQDVQRKLQDAVAAEDLQALDRVGSTQEHFLAALQAARANPAFRAERLDQLEADFTTYAQHAKATSARLIAADSRVGTELATMSARYTALRGTLQKGIDDSRQERSAAFTRLRDTQQTSLQVVGVLVLACMGALGVVSIRLISQVLGPLAKLTLAAHRIASEGDLTQTIEVHSKDELGQLAGAFAKMVGLMREVHCGIEESVHKLAAAASQIYASCQEQEAASETQSSGAEEVASTMQSLLETATHIADSASGVFDNAERSKETSASTARKISELSAHTARMVEILEVIREIADRSDLLALNASLEGTRAGEAGRGFSLVANEMRRLSERVTASVGDVKALVTDIRASGASTVMMTEEARKLAEGTAASAKQITLVTQQQRTATEQVSRSLNGVAGVLMQTVAANRQTKRAAEDLKAQAERLTALSGRFRGEAAKK